MNSLNLFLIAFSFVFTLFFTKFSVIKLKKYGLIAPDLHKDGKPKKPRIGGISIAAGFVLSLIILYFFEESFSILLVLMTFLIAACIGLLDDFFRFGKIAKLILPGLAAIPLLFLIRWEIIPILLLFAAVAILSNWTNMLAGFNGLEIGLGCIILFFLALSSSSSVIIILLIYSASLLAFLFFNKYPAEIFPGDVGTLPIGAVLIASVLLGAPLLTLLILIIPYFIDASLKFFSAGIVSTSNFEPTIIREGRLVPRDNYLSLPKVIMKIKPLKEWQLVSIILGIEIVLGGITLLI